MLNTSIAIVLAAVAPLLQQDDPPTRPARQIPTEVRDRIERGTASEETLDPRIDASKITELDVPFDVGG